VELRFNKDQQPENTIRVWDVAEGKEVLSFPGDADCLFGRMAYSPDGSRLVALAGPTRLGTNTAVGFVVSQQTAVKVWDARTGAEVLTWKADEARLSTLAFSADGSRLAVGTFASPGHPAEVWVWDLADGAELFRLAGHIGTVSGIAFSRDGTRIATAARSDGTPGSTQSAVKVWDGTSGRGLLNLSWEARGPAPQTTLAFAADGNQLLLDENRMSEAFDSLHVWDGTPRP
jgi:WD40 repeat protein